MSMNVQTKKHCKNNSRGISKGGPYTPAPAFVFADTTTQ